MLKNYNPLFANKYIVSTLLTNGVADKDEEKKPSFDGFGKDFSYRVNLDPDEDYYVFTPDKQNGEIKILANLKNCMISAESLSASNVTGYNDGKVTISGNKGDYLLGLTVNDPINKFPWFNVDVKNRSNAKTGALELKSDGMVFYSDKISNVEVTVDELESLTDGIATATFSTDYPSVKFMAVDDDTLGVYVDTDSDGTYETIIADSDGTYETIIADSDGTEYGDSGSEKPEQPQEGSETAQTSAQQTSTVQEQSQPEQQSAGTGAVSRTEQSEPRTSPAAETVQQSSEPVASADYGFVPWVGGALLAAVIAAAVVVMVRKRHGRKE